MSANWNWVREHALFVVAVACAAGIAAGWATCWNVWASPAIEERDDLRSKLDNIDGKLDALREDIGHANGRLEARSKDIERLEDRVVRMDLKLSAVESTQASEIGGIVAVLKENPEITSFAKEIDLFGERVGAVETTLKSVQASINGGSLALKELTLDDGEGHDITFSATGIRFRYHPGQGHPTYDWVVTRSHVGPVAAMSFSGNTTGHGVLKVTRLETD